MESQPLWVETGQLMGSGCIGQYIEEVAGVWGLGSCFGYLVAEVQKMVLVSAVTERQDSHKPLLSCCSVFPFSLRPLL